MNRIALAALVILLGGSASAQEVQVKLATLAPQGSPWHNLLKELAERWTAVSAGKVKLRIYAGGTQGSEGDMLRKMGVGQLQAASITNIGMHDLLKEPSVYSTPGIVDSAVEFQAVFPRVEKKLEALLLDRDYVVLNWAQVGTVQIFCSKPYRSPAEMHDARFFVWDGDPASVDAFRQVGFRPVVLSATDMVPSLQTGMINCLTQPAAYVLTARLFEKANKMIDYPWAYLIGATLVRKETWDKVPADLRPKLIAIARELGARIDAEAKRVNDDAVAAMQKQGLEIVKVDPAVWRAAAERSWTAVRGKVVPAEFFDEVVKYRDEYRKGKK